MIDQLYGKIVAVGTDYLVVEVNGLGYRVQVPASLLAVHTGTGPTIRLYTHLIVREDAMELYGFEEELEKKAFLHLLGVSGIGPRTSLAIVSQLGAQQFWSAVLQEDTTLLATAPGIGLKSAKRIVVELKDRLEKLKMIEKVDNMGAVASSEQQEALAALQSLGYTAREAGEALNKIPDKDIPAAELIKAALRLLGRG